MALTFISDEARSLFIFSIAMGIICTLATALRFLSTVNSSRKVGFEDWFALGALVSYLAYIACDLTALGILSGKDLETISPDDLSALGKALFATVAFFPVNQLCAKFSILYLYYRLFSVNRNFVRWTYVIGSIQILCSTVTLFINLFSCIPINYNWDFDVEGYCLNQGAIFAGTESVNSAVDLAMVALAIFMVRELRLRLWTKLKLAFIFALGSLSGVIGYVRIAEFYLEATPDSVGVFSATQGFWESAQMAASIICCCSPIYKNILPIATFYTRIISHVGSFSWRRPSNSWGSSSKPFPSSGAEEQSYPSVDTYGASRPAQRHQQWLSLNDSSQNGLTWVEMETDPHHADVMEARHAMKATGLEEQFRLT
ncbi:hypothetical protein M426DRAFT_326021 [Hypoxylon sp. CI-4A]|nr:hypothetical protein M426DRAFT_326021 [Hypoxylon sp. CI-4A]